MLDFVQRRLLESAWAIGHFASTIVVSYPSISSLDALLIILVNNQVCAGLSTRLQEHKSENAQLEELLIAEVRKWMFWFIYNLEHYELTKKIGLLVYI